VSIPSGKLSMKRFWIFFIAATVLTLGSSCGQSRVASPIVILEASSTYQGIGGYQKTLLLLRLTDDGKVEWDKPMGEAICSYEKNGFRRSGGTKDFFGNAAL
jgi:hypothetical protein